MNPSVSKVRLCTVICFIFFISMVSIADEIPGESIYKAECVRCHAEGGIGTQLAPDPLLGDLSLNQLAAYIDEAMPEDDPSKVTGEDAVRVANYIYNGFYSAVARERNRPARVEMARLTNRQYQNTLADLLGFFRGNGPEVDSQRGLQGQYFSGRGFSQKNLVLERIDQKIDFSFEKGVPEYEKLTSGRFAIRWIGSIVPTETGIYEFVIRTKHSTKLTLNTAAHQPPLIDAYVQSGDTTEHRGNIRLLGGRCYPLAIEFIKANQGVNNEKREHDIPASISLLWKPPNGVLEPVPTRVLIPSTSPLVFVTNTSFPPDDKSIGYERGMNISKEWVASTMEAARETASYVIENIDELAKVSRDSPDRKKKLKDFATSFTTQAFRRPLTDDLSSVFIDQPFQDSPDLDTATKRSVTLTLISPRFLFNDYSFRSDSFATAARLSFGLWDSLPDKVIWNLALRNRLDPSQIRIQAERMVRDRRTRSKVRDFLFSWLNVDIAPELVKDDRVYGDMSPAIASDLRASFELFLDDVVWSDGDFRHLITADEIFLNPQLAAVYGTRVPSDDRFHQKRIDDGRRAGIITHPYLLSTLAYPDTTSPIHRGVFLARCVLGNVLRPPEEAIAPTPPKEHPDLTTRERVALQTKAANCQVCHAMINPLGFALEEFDGIGRYRTSEQVGKEKKNIDNRGFYVPREGARTDFHGGRELATFLAESHDFHEAFVQNLFQNLVKQPIQAWGPDTLEKLVNSLEKHNFDIRQLLVDIMVIAASEPAS